MKDAVEMAVLSHIRHPAVVGVYGCFTDMVEEAGDPGASPPASARLPRYRPLRPDDPQEAMACSIIVMEYCDQGTLRDAIGRGVVHARMSDKMIAIDILTAAEILLQIARSIAFVHERGLLHCDIKTENILIKTDVSSSLGFACKLADFGLAKMLNQE
ncbi:hypothetical protein MNEG_7406 [Monoraphidium neglectum]|uniref:non-specific serine/threonine protein kinase n=1 Tax=Monoraphidium neglectum TaxID=145388 RepID=A0A0D2MBA9_9CHLO|nr:hypothetical protein MNEG_7406 [Monoraphidium neglectum]KIZ00555.1 hypothetical protein MNEG_7406 [Monoraphidium neglectum]|eukprot:XP_013899574.1 hypothetical protein MNEG_7406 [Monoraphidium neglectum]